MRAILTSTLCLNLVLAVVLWRTKSTVAVTPERRIRIQETNDQATPAASTNQRVVVVAGDDGSPWSALSAAHYRDCIERLRAAGCPEETMRDIVIAAISHRAYAQLVALEDQHYRNYKSWRGIQDDDFDFDPLAAQKIKSNRDLEVAALFGADWRKDAYKIIGWKIDQSYWSFMPEEKRAEMEMLNAKYAKLESDVRKKVHGSFLLEEEEAELKQLKEQKRAELAQLLTPQELEQLDVRNSPAANWVRQRLPEAASAEEFLKMFRAAAAAGKDFANEHSLQNGESPQDSEKRRAEEEKVFQAQLKAALGDARYAQLFPNAPPGAEPEPTFEESAEDARKELLKLAQKEGVSAEAANQAHAQLLAVIKDFEKQHGVSVEKLSPEQSAEFNKLIKEKGEKIFIETMGEKGRAVFKRMNHDE